MTCNPGRCPGLRFDRAVGAQRRRRVSEPKAARGGAAEDGKPGN